MMTSGGKSAGAPAPGPILKTGQTFIEESLSPLGDDFTWQIEPFTDSLVPKPLGGKENCLGAHDHEIR